MCFPTPPRSRHHVTFDIPAQKPFIELTFGRWKDTKDSLPVHRGTRRFEISLEILCGLPAAG